MPRRWHEALSEIFWAYENSNKFTANVLTLFRLNYGRDAVLPLEITIKLLRVLSKMTYNLITTT